MTVIWDLSSQRAASLHLFAYRLFRVVLCRAVLCCVVLRRVALRGVARCVVLCFASRPLVFIVQIECRFFISGSHRHSLLQLCLHHATPQRLILPP